MSGSAGAIRAGRAFVELFADNSKLQAGLKVAENAVKNFGQRVSTIGKQVAMAGGLAAAPMAISTKIFAGFDDQMRGVQAVTGATGEQFDLLTEKAKLLGRTTSFTAAQVASGMLELGRAGFKSDEIDNAIAHVMNLARATQTEIPLATEIAGNALRGFAMDASQMGRVSDVLTATANNSSQTLEDLGEAFKYVAPIANEAGMSIEDTSKVLGTLANFGIKGSMAGTTVKNILTRMADPEIQKKYEELGVKVTDVNGKLRNMSDVLLDVGRATESLPNAQKLAIFKELFDMRAMAGGAKLTSAAFQEMFDAIDNAAGASDRVAKTMDEGIGGAFRMFLSAAEGMAIAIGTALAPEIKRFSDYLTESQTKITEWINAHKEAIVSCAQLAAKAIVVGGSLYVIGKAATAVSAMIGILRSSLVALRVAGVLLSTNFQNVGQVFGRLKNIFKPFDDSVAATGNAKAPVTMKALRTSAAQATGAVEALSAAVSINNRLLTTSVAATDALTASTNALGFTFARSAKYSTAYSATLAELSAMLKALLTSLAAATTQTSGFNASCVILNNTLRLLTVQTGALAAAGRGALVIVEQGAQLILTANTALTATFRLLTQSIGQAAVALVTYGQLQIATATQTAAALAVCGEYPIVLAQGTAATIANTTAQSARTVVLTAQSNAERVLAGTTAAQTTALIAQNAASVASTGSAGIFSRVMAGLCRVPFSAWMIGGTAAVYFGIKALNSIGKHVADLTDKYKGLVNVQTRSSQTGMQKTENQRGDLDKLKRLQELSQKPTLNNSELAESKKLVAELESQYGSFGAQIDDVSKSVTLMGDAFKNVLAAMGQSQLADVNNRIGELKRNQEEIRKENEYLSSYWGNYNYDSVHQLWNPEHETKNQKRSNELAGKSAEISSELAELEKLKAKLESGDTDVVVETVSQGGASPVPDMTGEEDYNAFVSTLQSEPQSSGGGETTVTPEDLQKMREDYNKSSAFLTGKINGATTQSERDNYTAQLNDLDKLFADRFSGMLGKLGSVQNEEGFWKEMESSQMTDEDREVAELNKKLADFVQDADKSYETGKSLGLTTMDLNGQTYSLEEGTQVKKDLAADAVNKLIEEVRKKYQEERAQKAADAQISDADLALAAAESEKIAKQTALSDAVKEGDEKKIATAQEEYNAADTAVKTAETNKARSNVDAAVTEMNDARDAYQKAVESGDVEAQTAAKEKWDSAKGKQDEALSYLAQFSPESTKVSESDRNLALAESQKTASQVALSSAYLSGDQTKISQAEEGYEMADYQYKQAEYAKALSDAQNAVAEMSTAEADYKKALESGSDEEKKAAKERWETARGNQSQALSNLAALNPQESLNDVAQDYSRDEEKSEVTRSTTTKGTFSAFEAMGQSFDWQRSNGEKQLGELTKIRENLEEQNGDYI